MAPVDMALMESGSDNQSEQQSSTRMSRVVAVLVVLGLVGSAFLLGRSSVTASISQSVQLFTPNPSCVPPAATVNLENELSAAITAAPAQALATCSAYRAKCTNPFDVNKINANPYCKLNPTCIATTTQADLETQFKAAIAAQPTMTKHICDTFKAACILQAPLLAWVTARPRCNGMSPCHGGASPVCEPSTAGMATPDLGEQFSCATQGRPESAMMGICAIFQAKCTQPQDAAWIRNRPRCNMKIPRHDGTLDDIN